MIEPARHIYATFDKALSALREDVLMMATLTQRNLNNAINGLFKRDDDLCTAVIADDEEVDQLEKQVDQDGVAIMLRFQPVASDLRRVVSAMKVSTNLERTADQAVNIARRARKLNQEPALQELPILEPMCWEAIALLKDAVQAYTEDDVSLAYSLKPRDRKLDEHDTNISRQVTDCMSMRPDRIKAYLNMIFVARHLERVGDHATNIAEDTIYAAAAEDIRHTQHKVE